MAIDMTSAGKMLVERHNEFVQDERRGFVQMNPAPEDAASMLLTVEEELNDFDRELLHLYIAHLNRERMVS